MKWSQRGSALKSPQSPAEVSGFVAWILPVSLKTGRMTTPLWRHRVVDQTVSVFTHGSSYKKWTSAKPADLSFIIKVWSHGTLDTKSLLSYDTFSNSWWNVLRLEWTLLAFTWYLACLSWENNLTYITYNNSIFYPNQESCFWPYGLYGYSLKKNCTFLFISYILLQWTFPQGNHGRMHAFKIVFYVWKNFTLCYSEVCNGRG